MTELVESETVRRASSVERRMAVAMASSLRDAPQATVTATADFTETLVALAEWRSSAGLADVSVTPLLAVARACVLAAEHHPRVLARWDEPDTVVDRRDVNLGIAVNTPRGLLVPHIKQAQLLDLEGLARGLDSLKQAARSGRVPLDQMRGGTMTISNVGTLGIETATPILNPGESIILAVGTLAERPWVHEGHLAVRSVATLSLTIDHRMVDGATAGEFLGQVVRTLEHPAELGRRPHEFL